MNPMKLLHIDFGADRRGAVNKLAGWLMTASLLRTAGAQAELGEPEKEEDLKLGFIKLTDMAPQAIAGEERLFRGGGPLR
jgi:hypothetical protein